MPINDEVKRKAYYRDRYYRTREQALEGVARLHARRLAVLATNYADQPDERERLMAEYLREHCKFKPEVIQ